MWQRLTLYDIRVIGHYLGSLVFYAAFVAIIPFVTGLLCMEWTAAARYLEAIGLFLITGMGLRFCRIQPGRLNRQQALVVTGLAWIVIALVAAIPLFQSGHYISYLDALFDAVSGVTTTGASVVVDLDHFSYADNMWRFMLHLVGGLGLLVVVLSLGLLGRGGGGSSALYSSEGRSEHVVPNVVQTAQFITRFSLAFVGASTILLMIICVFIGIEPLRAFLQAFWLSISAFMTAGFTPMSQSAMYYHSIGMEFIFMILMILGSISFGIHAEIRKGSVTAFFKDLEIRTMVIWLAVLTCVLAASLSASPNFSDLPAMLRRGLFTEISAFTTTGFMDITSTQLNSVFSSGAFMIIAILMGVGGSAGSTSGGIKFQRLGVIGKSIATTIKETLAPDSVRITSSYYHIGRHRVDSDLVKNAMTVFVLYVATYLIGTLIGIAHGYDATQALFDSISMASNGGITCGVASPGMPGALEGFYIFEMWAGRLEFVTLIALLVELVITAAPRKLVDVVRRQKREVF